MRSFRWIKRFNEGEGRISVTIDRSKEEYVVSVFPAFDGGVGIRFYKIRGGIHDVLVQEDVVCDCWGFTRWGHCKHSTLVKEWLKNGDVR